MSKKVVLGFSGGLDTSYCVKYLTGEKGYEVHSIVVNTGGFSDEELKQIEAHAYRLGVASHKTVNAVKSYYDSIIKYLVYGNVLKNNTYPLSVSAERLSQALYIATYAEEIQADAVAHGSTGAGNDQVELRLAALFKCWIDQILAVDQADADTGDRSGKRNVRQIKRARCAGDGDDVGIVFRVGGDHRSDDLRFKTISIRK